MAYWDFKENIANKDQFILFVEAMSAYIGKKFP
jgi:hypothetical protein